MRWVGIGFEWIAFSLNVQYLLKVQANPVSTQGSVSAASARTPNRGMNHAQSRSRLNPKTLLLSKWTAVAPVTCADF
jgi:hypothetical protein